MNAPKVIWMIVARDENGHEEIDDGPYTSLSKAKAECVQLNDFRMMDWPKFRPVKYVLAEGKRAY